MQFTVEIDNIQLSLLARALGGMGEIRSTSPSETIEDEEGVLRGSLWDQINRGLVTANGE